jgi:hypothetical protein
VELTTDELVHDVEPVKRNWTIYDAAAPPLDGDCQDTVIVVAVVLDVARLLTGPGTAVTAIVVGMAANAMVPAE